MVAWIEAQGVVASSVMCPYVALMCPWHGVFNRHATQTLSFQARAIVAEESSLGPMLVEFTNLEKKKSRAEAAGITWREGRRGIDEA